MINRLYSFIILFLLLSITVQSVHASDLIDLVENVYVSIHENPELGHKEFKTQALIQETLKDIGFKDFIKSERAPTAVIALLDSGKPGPTIALRADMDARPVQENKNHSPVSKIDGVMHNCGHDAHTAMLIGAAHYLFNHPDSFAGKIVFLFQPAEEIRGGADDIVAEGILRDLGVEAIFAQHVYTEMPVGTIALSSGESLAGSNYFTLTIKGNGSHAALPSGGSDTLVAASKILVDLAELPARVLNIVEQPVVISPTLIATNNSSSNVIPSEVTVKGTIRAFTDLFDDDENGNSIEKVILKRIEALANAYNVKADMAIRAGSPPTINNKLLYEKTIKGIQQHWTGKVQLDIPKGMFSEDFAFYTADLPALYLSLGIAKDGLGEAGVHTSDFTLHPDALPEGVKLLIYLAQLHSLNKISAVNF